MTKEQTYRLNTFVLVGVLLTFASAVHAERTNTPKERHFSTALPGEECRVPPPSRWTESEKSAWIQTPKWTDPEEWAWTQICEGQIANFNEHLNEELDPRNPDHDDEWADDRMLSSRFLETILLREPFRGAIPRRGVRIFGAYFPNPINLIDVSLDRPLEFDQSRFKSQVDMLRLRTPTFISLEDSKFDSELDMDSISVGGDLFMRAAEFDKVDLRGAKIGDQLSMNGSTFKDELIMSSASVGSSLFMRGAEFDEVNLSGAKIGDHLSMNRSVFKKVNLSGAKIGDHLGMNGSVFKDELIMDSASIGGTLFMREVTLDKPPNLIFLSIGSNLDARLATMSGLDLTGSRIEGELRLGSPDANIEWKSYTDENGDCQAPKLTLRNASIGALQDTTDTWPGNLEREFEGFTYDRLGGLGASEQEKPDERESSWFIEWLAKK